MATLDTVLEVVNLRRKRMVMVPMVMVMVMEETETETETVMAMVPETVETVLAETAAEMVEAMADKRIPRKKGQPAGSDKHSDLYTDENPKGTIHGLKFATVEDAKASVAKIKNSGKKHAHKIQAAIAMEQRARVMGKTGPAAVYRKYINQMKKKTKQMQKEDIQEGRPGLWDNIRKRRASGKRMRKKGEKGAPSPEAMARASAASEEMTTTASIPNPIDTSMGPKFTTTNVMDRRKKKRPALLKRFSQYISK